MSSFICPICRENLCENQKTLSCQNNHNFDVSKRGYVNLLLSQKEKGKGHGDDKSMVQSRQSFLDKGYYNSLLKNVFSTIDKYVKNPSLILDAGCGECWFTANIYEHLTINNKKISMVGVDISRDALYLGAKRNRNIGYAVASLYNLPIKDKSCSVILNIFAPFCNQEFHRVLKKDGIIVKVIPLEKHLWELKKTVYDKPYENEIENFEINGFLLNEKIEIKERIHLLSNQDIVNLFSMTPYFYKTSITDKNKLDTLSELNTEIEFGILVYSKI